MKCNPPIVGWYCPYIYPAIYSCSSIQPYLLDISEVGHKQLCGMPLCKKLTAVDTTIENKTVNGMIMVNCCNVSQNYYEYINTKIEKMNILNVTFPRFYDKNFKSAYLDIIATIHRWVGNVYGRSNGHITVKNRPLLKYGRCFVDASCIDLMSKTNRWCTIINVNNLLQYNTVSDSLLEFLIKNIRCPRMLNDPTSYSHKQFVNDHNHTVLTDPFCVLQSYLSAQSS